MSTILYFENAGLNEWHSAQCTPSTNSYTKRPAHYEYASRLPKCWYDWTNVLQLLVEIGGSSALRCSADETILCWSPLRVYLLSIQLGCWFDVSRLLLNGSYLVCFDREMIWGKRFLTFDMSVVMDMFICTTHVWNLVCVGLCTSMWHCRQSLDIQSRPKTYELACVYRMTGGSEPCRCLKVRKWHRFSWKWVDVSYVQ